MNKIDILINDLESLDFQRNSNPDERSVMTLGAQQFISQLHKRFEPQRRMLLEKRKRIQEQIESGWNPSFLKETKSIRDSEWKASSSPDALIDRRVEITGPVDRKMIINGLNSGANVFMADFEDSCSPTWKNIISGQKNLIDAISGTISLDDKKTGKKYRLAENPAVLIVRPRGLHLDEHHVKVDGAVISASIFDFGLFFYHNAISLSKKQLGPFFYIPKIENYHEARLWKEIIQFSEDTLNIHRGSTRVTVLIETILAGYEMDEIIYELRDYISGLNCGRWDYIFSKIKKFKNRSNFIFPDRAFVTMDTQYMRAYSKLLIQTCHNRGIHAMGGMAAQIPIKNNLEANNDALDKVRKDKEREAKDGHDGTWVAHPGLVDIALNTFNNHMPDFNQINKPLSFSLDKNIQLMGVPSGKITTDGLVQNIQVGIKYIAAWLSGSGCVPINNLMEDAATAEIARAQLWQWKHHGALTEENTVISSELINKHINRQINLISEGSINDVFINQAGLLFKDIVLCDQFQDFLTVPAYDQLISNESIK